VRTITVITGARSEYGIYLPILRKIEADPKLGLELVVTGMHLAPEFGMTVRNIEQHGFTIRDRVEMLLASDSPEGVAKSVGLGVIGFAQAYARRPPDLLLVLGDRFEMLAAVLASMTFKVPVAHIHGGESTEGLIDEAIRHSITKMSHLHFAATDKYARRLVQMGEPPNRVVVSGAPALDHLSSLKPLNRNQLQERFGIDISEPTLLVTFHPVTLEYEQTGYHIDQLLAALRQTDCSVVFTYPNADTQGRLIIERIQGYVRDNRRAQVAVNLGTEGYFSLMSHAAAMVGNSSSGIIEAASFKLPVVNIGNRQRGRVRERNVIQVGYDCDDILAGIRQALSPQFREELQDLVNPYGDGNAAERIVSKLRSVQLDQDLLLKRFYDIE